MREPETNLSKKCFVHTGIANHMPSQTRCSSPETLNPSPFGRKRHQKPLHSWLWRSDEPREDEPWEDDVSHPNFGPVNTFYTRKRKPGFGTSIYGHQYPSPPSPFCPPYPLPPSPGHQYPSTPSPFGPQYLPPPSPFGRPRCPSFNPSRDLRKSIQNQTDVALGITKHLLLNLGSAKNVVYSPLSIHVVLSMLVAGTKQGDVQEQLLHFLKSNSLKELNDLASNVVPLVFADGSSSGGPRLSFANGVWVEKTLGVKHCFKQVMDTVYKAEMLQVDFKTRAEEARLQVNSWAEKESMGLIKEILPPGYVNSMTRIILGNALYFKGDWDQKFDASATRLDKFYLLSNNNNTMSFVKAPFLSSTKFQCIRAFDDFKVLKLFYKQGKDYERRFAMYVFLPNARDGLQTLAERVCSSSEFIGQHSPYGAVPVGRFLFPKFKITCGFEAFEFLVTLGFSPEDFTEMVEDENIFLNQILHKSFIEVNEEGTEAAAVTVATMIGCSAGPPPPLPPPIDFVADHPFLYMIIEEVSKTVMFIGHVLNPIAQEEVKLN